MTVIRIAPGSATDKQGLLHVGDIIAEVNGVPVQTPDQLGDVIQRSGPDIKFKVLPPKHKTVAGYEVCQIYFDTVLLCVTFGGMFFVALSELN